MACRKAAYRAEIERSEWMEAQQAKKDANYKAIVQEISPYWGGSTESLFEQQFCIRWIAKGPEVPGGSGCSGGCGKEHVRVVLDWRRQQTNQENDVSSSSSSSYSAIATVSHLLKPFQEYFSNLVTTGKATKLSDTEYQLSGFLPELLKEFESKFPKHLIKLASHTALRESTLAYRKHVLEQLESNVKKKQKLRGPAADTGLLEQALEICCHVSLADHLDWAELACLRCTNTTFRRLAQSMIRDSVCGCHLQRQQQNQSLELHLWYSVFNPFDYVAFLNNDEDNTDPTGQEEGNHNHNNNTRRILQTQCHVVLVPKQKAILNQSTTKTTSSSNSHDDKQNNDEETITFQPSSSDFEIQWRRYHSEDEEATYSSNPVFRFHFSLSDDRPESACLFDKTKPLEVAFFPIPDDHLFEGTHEVTLPCGACLSYTVKQQQQEQQPASDENENSNNSDNNPRNSHLLLTISNLQVQFHFEDLLGIYVRKKLPLAKQKLSTIKQTRPLLQQEKIMSKHWLPWHERHPDMHMHFRECKDGNNNT